ncbi:MAG: serine protease, partial [Verrucomicrobiota bacterium]
IKGQGPLVYSSAAAVDNRGYFLCSAHSVKQDYQIFLNIVTQGEAAAIFPARLVWKGSQSSFRSKDLALLHINQQLPAVFPLGQPLKGEAVMGCGLNYPKSENVKFDLSVATFGGEISSVLPFPDHALPHDLVFNSLPLQKGDSGGPVMNARGELVGISVKSTFFVTGARKLDDHRSLAILPDSRWLQSKIDEDWKAVAKDGYRNKVP